MAYDEEALVALNSAIKLGTTTGRMLRRFMKWRDEGRDGDATLALTQDQVDQLESDYRRGLNAFKTAVSNLSVPQ